MSLSPWACDISTDSLSDSSELSSTAGGGLVSSEDYFWLCGIFSVICGSSFPFLSRNCTQIFIHQKVFLLFLQNIPSHVKGSLVRLFPEASSVQPACSCFLFLPLTISSSACLFSPILEMSSSTCQPCSSPCCRGWLLSFSSWRSASPSSLPFAVMFRLFLSSTFSFLSPASSPLCCIIVPSTTSEQPLLEGGGGWGRGTLPSETIFLEMFWCHFTSVSGDTKYIPMQHLAL